MIVLDTNIVIALMNEQPLIVGERLVEAMEQGEEIVIPSVVVFEFWFGVANSSRKSGNAEKLSAILSRFPLMPLDADDAKSSAQVRHELRQAGTPIGPYDTLIAGQALRHGATLATANVREFARVKELRVEDWSN